MVLNIQSFSIYAGSTASRSRQRDTVATTIALVRGNMSHSTLQQRINYNAAPNALGTSPQRCKGCGTECHFPAGACESFTASVVSCCTPCLCVPTLLSRHFFKAHSDAAVSCYRGQGGVSAAAAIDGQSRPST